WLPKASLVLNIAQPALSAHVRNMELELGAMLLLRGAHGVRPTVAGKTLIEHARVVIDRVEQARREIADQQAEPSGERAGSATLPSRGSRFVRLAVRYPAGHQSWSGGRAPR